MEVIKLKNVKLANAIKVDREDTVFKSDNYDITLEDRFFINVVHKITKKRTETTVYNMINMNREQILEPGSSPRMPIPKAAEVVIAPVIVVDAESEKAKELAAIAEIEEKRRLAKIADREKRLAAKGAPPALVQPTVKIKKSNKSLE